MFTLYLKLWEITGRLRGKIYMCLKGVTNHSLGVEDTVLYFLKEP